MSTLYRKNRNGKKREKIKEGRKITAGTIQLVNLTISDSLTIQ